MRQKRAVFPLRRFCVRGHGKKLEIKECPAAPRHDARRERGWHAVILLLFLIKGTPSSIIRKVWRWKQQKRKVMQVVVKLGKGHFCSFNLHFETYVNVTRLHFSFLLLPQTFTSTAPPKLLMSSDNMKGKKEQQRS